VDGLCVLHIIRRKVQIMATPYDDWTRGRSNLPHSRATERFNPVSFTLDEGGRTADLRGSVILDALRIGEAERFGGPDSLELGMK